MKTKDVTGKMGENAESLISTCLLRKSTKFIEFMHFLNKSSSFFLLHVGGKINEYHFVVGRDFTMLEELVEQTIN